MTLIKDVTSIPFNTCAMIGFVEVFKPLRGKESSKAQAYNNATTVYSVCNQMMWIGAKNLMKSGSQIDPTICQRKDLVPLLAIHVFVSFGVALGAAVVTDMIGKGKKKWTIPHEEVDYLTGAGV